MKSWKEVKSEARKVSPDKEMAKSLLKMIKIRLDELESKDREKFASLIVEDYYEVINESITALMSTDGYKTFSHEALMIYLREFYSQFSYDEILLCDELRKLRNKIVYKGFFITPGFLGRNEKRIKDVIEKLLKVLEDKII